MSAAEGRALIERAQAGDQQAFADLCERSRRSIFTYARSKVGHTETAEDIVQETFLRAWRQLASWSWQGKDPQGWLTTIAANLCADHHRTAWQRRVRLYGLFDATHELQPVDPSPEGEPENLVLRELVDYRPLHVALAGLSKEQREVLYLRYAQEQPVRAAAQTTGRGEGAVKSLTYRGARAVLRFLGPEQVAIYREGNAA